MINLLKVNWFNKLIKKKPTQTLWIWCPGCKKDLCSNNSFVRDEDFVYYKCTNCRHESVWDFDTYGPAVVLVDSKEAMKPCAQLSI